MALFCIVAPLICLFTSITILDQSYGPACPIMPRGTNILLFHSDVRMPQTSNTRTPSPKKKRPSCLSQKSQIQKHSGNWPDMHKPKNPCCTKVFCVNTRYSTEKKVALRQIEYKHLDVCFLPFHIVGHVLHEA